MLLVKMMMMMIRLMLMMLMLSIKDIPDENLSSAIEFKVFKDNNKLELLLFLVIDRGTVLLHNLKTEQKTELMHYISNSLVHSRSATHTYLFIPLGFWIQNYEKYRAVMMNIRS